MREITCKDLEEKFPQKFRGCCEVCHINTDPSSKLRTPIEHGPLTFRICCNKRGDLDTFKNLNPDFYAQILSSFREEYIVSEDII